MAKATTWRESYTSPTTENEPVEDGTHVSNEVLAEAQPPGSPVYSKLSPPIPPSRSR